MSQHELLQIAWLSFTHRMLYCLEHFQEHLAENKPKLDVLGVRTSEAGLSHQMTGKAGTQLRLEETWSSGYEHPWDFLSHDSTYQCRPTASSLWGMWALTISELNFSSCQLPPGPEIPQPGCNILKKEMGSWGTLWHCSYSSLLPESSFLSSTVKFSWKTDYIFHSLAMFGWGEDSSMWILSPSLRRPL